MLVNREDACFALYPDPSGVGFGYRVDQIIRGRFSSSPMRACMAENDRFPRSDQAGDVLPQASMLNGRALRHSPL